MGVKKPAAKSVEALYLEISNRDAEDTAYCTGMELANFAIGLRGKGAFMGQVIHVAFGTEREWEQTHAKTVDGLVAIGTLFGDDEALTLAVEQLDAKIRLKRFDLVADRALRDRKLLGGPREAFMPRRRLKDFQRIQWW